MKYVRCEGLSAQCLARSSPQWVGIAQGVSINLVRGPVVESVFHLQTVSFCPSEAAQQADLETLMF